jgi:antitoxin component YwqK of YwqJK toxin-antitoxin module
MFERLLGRRNIKNPKNGKWKEFNKQAVLVAEGNYQQDLKQGLWNLYYETGELLIEETYERGILHGRYASYHLNGWLLSEGRYVQGQREGYFHVYDEYGNQLKRLLFVNNVLVDEVDTSKHPVSTRIAV